MITAKMKYILMFVFSTTLIMNFQNCSRGFKTSDVLMTSEFASIPGAGMPATSEPLTFDQLSLKGAELYAANCFGCHSVITQTTIRSKTAASITTALSSQPLMLGLKSLFSQQDILALEAALNPVVVGPMPPVVVTPTPVPPPPVTTNNDTQDFVCADEASKKKSSIVQRRLTNNELIFSYRSVLPAAIYSSLTLNDFAKFPADFFGSYVSNGFTNLYVPEQIEAISLLNDKLATQLTANDATLKTFFGSCATLTSFTKSCFTTFMSTKGVRIVRTALSTVEIDNYYAGFTAITNVKQGYQYLVNLLFIDPRFLHHIEEGMTNPDSTGFIRLTPYEVANRISYGLTSAPPDDLLFAAAQQNLLSTPVQIAAQVDRLVTSEAFKLKTIAMIRYYLSVADPSLFQSADFLQGINTTGLVAAASKEFDDYIRYVIFDLKGTFKDLLTSDAVFPSQAELAKVMQSTVWQSGATALRSANYTGLLSRPYLMMGGAENVSLILRGVKLRKYFLCDTLALPATTNAGALATITDADYVNLTNRMRTDKMTSPASCMACHTNINNLGVMTSRYDQLGRYIATERSYNTSLAFASSHPVDASAAPLISPFDTTVFNGMKEFAFGAANSLKAQQCFAKRSFQYFNVITENLSLDSCQLKEVTNLVTTQQSVVNSLAQHFKTDRLFYKKVN